MTPKEKAKELVEKYAIWSWNEAKQCALIAVDEILKALPEDYQNDIWSYWQEVKQEIEKL
jgi:hypothetical protein